MERRRRRTILSEEEKIALVKAAAWAWYQRGVGDEGMVEREFRSLQPPRELRPSRFKLEAAAAAAMREQRDDPRNPSRSIGRDRGGAATSTDARRETRGAPQRISRPIGGGVEANRKKKPVPLKMNGFWMKHAVGVCGPPADVVHTLTATAPPPPREARGKSRGAAAARIGKS